MAKHGETPPPPDDKNSKQILDSREVFTHSLRHAGSVLSSAEVMVQLVPYNADATYNLTTTRRQGPLAGLRRAFQRHAQAARTELEERTAGHNNIPYM